MVSRPAPIPALIPAKARSRRLANKNMRPFAGKPLVQHSIEQALAAPGIGPVYVSSDCVDILALAETCGARAILRPEKLADDAAGAAGVMRHGAQMIAADGHDAHWLVYLQPTSPLRTVEDIEHCLALSRSGAWDTVTTVCESPVPPQRLWRWENGGVVPALPGADPFRRRQEQPTALALNGAVYVCRVAAVDASPSGGLLTGRVTNHEMDPRRSIDIDDIYDFTFAEHLFLYGGPEP